MPPKIRTGTNQDRVKRETAVRDRMFEKEKSVLDKTMDVSLRAMDREYAELRKKQNELVTVKSGIHHFKDSDQQRMRVERSHSNLAAASRQQLRVSDDGPSKTPSGRNLTVSRSTHRKLSAHNRVNIADQDPKPQASNTQPAQKQVQLENNRSKTPALSKTPVQSDKDTKSVGPVSKGKGKGPVTGKADKGSSEQSTSSEKKHGTGHKDTGSHRQGSSHAELHKRGSHQGTDVHHRKASITHRDRRESITGQTFNREEMEEQQKILDLFIHIVEEVDDKAFDPADVTAKLRDGSTSSMHERSHQQTGTGTPGGHHKQQNVAGGRPASQINKLNEDPKLMKDIKGLMKQRRMSINVHSTPPDGSDTDTPHGSRGKRRVSGLDMLSDIIGAYKTQYVKDVNFDPLAMLNCGYLRLSDSNVRELERLCREKGIEPGIHAHSNVDDFQLFPERN